MENVAQASPSDMVGRIRQRLAELELSPRAASLLTNRGADLIRNLTRAVESGKDYNPRIDTINAIAAVLKVSPLWLQFGDAYNKSELYFRDKPGSHSKKRSLIYGSDTPSYAGILETDVFRKVWRFGDLDYSDTEEVLEVKPPIGVDPRYPTIDQFFFLCRGDGAVKAGAVDGMYVTAVSCSQYIESVGPLRHGMYVIVAQETKTDDSDHYLKETSLRRYEVWADAVELQPLAREERRGALRLPPDWAPDDNRRPTIIGIATGIHLPFENEGFIPHSA